MRLLAIESSGWDASVAAWDTTQPHPLRTERTLPGQRSAQGLAPALARLLDAVGWRVGDLDAVAVAVGPGSFTGLRVGVTTAKTLAYAAGVPVAPVNTLAAIAAQCSEGAQCSDGALSAGAGGAGAPLWGVLDAHRGEVFAARFTGPPTDAAGADVQLLPLEAWLALLAAGDRVAGPLLTKVAERLPGGVTMAPEAQWAPRAETVARLAAATLQRGGGVGAMELVPQYYRPSAAEEHRAGAK